MTAPMQPYTLARYGIYAASVLSLLSVWLGLRNGAAFDFVLLRAVFFFVIVAALGFGAEAVLLLTPIPPPPPPEDDEALESHD